MSSMWRPCSIMLNLQLSSAGFLALHYQISFFYSNSFIASLSFSHWECWDRGSQQIIWIVDIYSPTFGCYGAVWYMAGAMWYCYHLSTSSVYTMQLCTRLQCQCIQSCTHSLGACVFSCCHLHFWQNVWDLLPAIEATQGWNGYWNRSQHRMLTQNLRPFNHKSIVLPLNYFHSPTWYIK